MKTKATVGDCFSIPLPDGRFSYCQYLQMNKEMGCLVRVLDVITGQPVSTVDELKNAGDLFPPVFVGLLASVRSGRWKFVGSLPVRSFRFPKFRATGATKPGTYDNWWIWDGESERLIGKLPENLRSLEQKLVWGDELLEQRIATGRDPFSGLQ